MQSLQFMIDRNGGTQVLLLIDRGKLGVGFYGSTLGLGKSEAHLFFKDVRPIAVCVAVGSSQRKNAKQP